ncbi:unnamed protein product [Meloidogyne enterolobii]|uniref:Uncharacterized protein n=2 Tax=Meloidogyne enterolobii TaxID=390850 RepID=A0ACB0YX22_MELEN
MTEVLNPQHQFLVISLLGDSLAAIKAQQPKKILSINSGLYCGIQMLESIKHLHDLGFVHRDIKPSNYILGISKTSSQNIVHIIDYGNARKIVGDDGKLEIPRTKARTIKFASRAMHRGVESGFKDDVECWLYALADIILRANVTWRYETNVEVVAEMKEEVFKNTETLFPGQEFSELRQIMSYLARKEYVDKMDYEWLRLMVKRIAKRKRCSLKV